MGGQCLGIEDCVERYPFPRTGGGDKPPLRKKAEDTGERLRVAAAIELDQLFLNLANLLNVNTLV